MNRTPETVALMEAVADMIEAHPERYDQQQWKVETECGTAYCLAGWACQIALGRLPWRNGVAATARDLLGLTDGERYNLFVESWKPHAGLSVPDALRKIAGGASIADVSREYDDEDDEDDEVGS